MHVHVCCVTGFSRYCFKTNATYRLAQVKWFTTVIWFESEVLPHCSCRVWLWTNSMSQLASRLFALLCSRLKHSRLPTQSPCDWQAPPPHTKDNATDKRVHFSYAKETRVVIQSRITNKYANEIIAAGKIIEVIFFIVRLIDLSTIATGLLLSFLFEKNKNKFWLNPNVWTVVYIICNVLMSIRQSSGINIFIKSVLLKRLKHFLK